MSDVLAIVAHPDDETFFAGGALAMHALAGCLVTVVTMTDGVGSRYRWWEADLRLSARRERRKAYEVACEALGVKGERDCVFLDQQADTVAQLTINRRVAFHIARHHPSVIYSHAPGDLNVDHRAVSEAVLVETRKSGVEVRMMSPEYPTRCVGQPFTPTLTVGYADNQVAWARRAHAINAYWMEMNATRRFELAMQNEEQFQVVT